MASMLALPCSFYIALLSLSLNLALAKKCEKLDTCSCKMDDGSGIISFQSLDNKDGKPEVTKIKQTIGGNFLFDWNPCTPLKETAACEGSNVCQKSTTGTDSFPCGGPDTTFSMVSNKVVMTYSKITYGTKPHTRYTILTLSCDKTKDTPSFGIGLKEDNPAKAISTYSGTLTSKCACPGHCSYSSKASSSGPSVGSILLIIFFSLLFLYFVVGIIVNKFARNKEGSDVIPNHSFWADFPFLIKDGCVFSCSKIRYCCGSIYHKAKGDSEYAQI